MNFGNFGNTNCYRYLTSQILAASRCGNYYGPDLFTEHNQPTYNRYQAQQQRLLLQKQKAAQDYLCPSNYGAFYNSITQKGMPDSLNQSLSLNQQMGRQNIRCRTNCNEITDSLWSATKKSSIYVADTATKWYECQREQSANSTNLAEKCKMFGISSGGGPMQPNQFLRLARPVRESEQKRMVPKRFKCISPEFLKLLEDHDNAMLAHNRLYGVDMNEGRPQFFPPSGHDRIHTPTPMDCNDAGKRSILRKSSVKTKAAEKPRRRGLIQTISDSCFGKPSSNKSSSGGGRVNYKNDDDDDDDIYRPSGGQDDGRADAYKKKNSNPTSRIIIRSKDMADTDFCGRIFMPEKDYNMAAALEEISEALPENIWYYERVINDEVSRVKKELAKRAQQKESASRKRNYEKEERAKAEERWRAKGKQNPKQKVKETAESDDERQISQFNKTLHRTKLNDESFTSKKQTEDESKQLKPIWAKKDKTRMRDSGILQQTEDMKLWAETETRLKPTYTDLHFEVGTLKRGSRDLGNVPYEKQSSLQKISKQHKDYYETQPQESDVEETLEKGRQSNQHRSVERERKEKRKRSSKKKPASDVESNCSFSCSSSAISSKRVSIEKKKVREDANKWLGSSTGSSKRYQIAAKKSQMKLTNGKSLYLNPYASDGLSEGNAEKSTISVVRSRQAKATTSKAAAKDRLKAETFKATDQSKGRTKEDKSTSGEGRHQSLVLKLANYLHRKKRMLQKKKGEMSLGLVKAPDQKNDNEEEKRKPKVYQNERRDELRKLRKELEPNKTHSLAPLERLISENELSEPSTSSLEEMLEHIKTELSKRKSKINNNKTISDTQVKIKKWKKSDFSTCNMSRKNNDKMPKSTPKIKKRYKINSYEDKFLDIHKPNTTRSSLKQGKSKKKAKTRPRTGIKLSRYFQLPDSPQVSEIYLPKSSKVQWKSKHEPILGTAEFILGTQHSIVNKVTKRGSKKPRKKLCTSSNC